MDIAKKETASATVVFPKAKRVRAESTAASVKKQLVSMETASERGPSELVQVMMFMREESNRKADLRREEAERMRQATRLEKEGCRLEKEEHRQHEREESERQRRQDREEAEERRQQDKEEAQIRAQEVLLMISAITKR